MGGWATWADLRADYANGKNIIIPYQKGGATPLVAVIPYSHFRSGGNPPAGVFPTAGLGSAVVCDDTTVGALPLPVISGAGEDLYLTGQGNAVCNGTFSTNNIQTIMLLDRLAHASVNHNQANGSFAPIIDGTARLVAGEGAMIIVEVATALSAASNVFTLTYSNEAGTAGRVTAQVSTVASAIVDRVPYSVGFFVPFQAGDSGARTITGWTLVSGTGTGVLTISLCKPVGMLGGMMRGAVYERDYAIQLPWMPRIDPNACLFPMHYQQLTGNDLRFSTFGIMRK